MLEQAECIVCGNPVEPVLDLGVQPPANTLLASPNDPFASYPLGLSACPRCSHGQLSYFVEPRELFTDYLYASGTSDTLRQYFAWLAHRLVQLVPEGGRILEIGSNDGSFLSALRDVRLHAVGLDPAERLNKVARAAGHDVTTGFFPASSPDGHFDLIVGMNVAAHTPDPVSFMAGVRRALAPGGIALIQTSQARMIENVEIDTIYHEHYSFFTVESMRALAARTGLHLEAMHLASVHGTSFVFLLSRDDAEQRRVPVAWEGDFALAETNLEGDALSWSGFAREAHDVMRTVAQAISDHESAGRDLALVGVAAKALTFIRALGVRPVAFFDEAELKVGRYVPGYDVPIRRLEEISALDHDTVFVIGAWNFADELIRKITELPLRIAPRFLTYYPRLREIEPGGI